MECKHMHSDIKLIVQAHSQNYAGMRPRDYVKLAYQHANGCEHMISNESAVKTRIESELNGEQLFAWFEDIGNGLARLHLTGGEYPLSAETVAGMFSYTARTFENRLPLEKVLSEITSCAPNDSELSEYIEEYKQAGMPPVSHSEEYRRQYSPKYRVVLKEFLKYAELFVRLEELMQKKERVTIAIDGMSASGKTSFSKMLSSVFKANVFHMDDFFLPQSMRTQERLSETGGNVHRERFFEEVLLPLISGNTVAYRAYDCQTGDYKPAETINPTRLNIVEGAYSCHPKLIEHYDLKIFMSISKDMQSERILKRNGQEMLKRFESVWIPMENKYIAEFKIKEKSDYSYQA